MTKLFVALEETQVLEPSELNSDAFFEYTEAERAYAATESETSAMFDTVGDAIDELNHIEKIQEIAKDGEHSETSEKLVEIAVEQITARLGVKGRYTYSAESISKLATDAIEAIKKFFKWIWSKLQEAYQYLRGMITKFLQWVGILKKENANTPDIDEANRKAQEEREKRKEEADKAFTESIRRQHQDKQQTNNTSSNTNARTEPAEVKIKLPEWLLRNKKSLVSSPIHYDDIFEGITGYSDSTAFIQAFEELLEKGIYKAILTREPEEAKQLKASAIAKFLEQRSLGNKNNNARVEVLNYTFSQTASSVFGNSGVLDKGYFSVTKLTEEYATATLRDAEPLSKKECEGILKSIETAANILKSDVERLTKSVNSLIKKFDDIEKEILESIGNSEMSSGIVKLMMKTYKDYPEILQAISSELSMAVAYVNTRLSICVRDSIAARKKAAE